MKFKGHSFLGYLLVHLGHKVASALFASSYFLLICMVSICGEKVWKISLLKSSNMLPISFLMEVVKGEEGGSEQLFFINQRRPQGPRPYQQGMHRKHYSYCNPNQTTPLQSWYSSTHPSRSTPASWPYAPPYPPQPVNHPFHAYPAQSSQWGCQHSDFP